jgi:hypothetical protein
VRSPHLWGSHKRLAPVLRQRHESRSRSTSRAEQIIQRRRCGRNSSCD